MTPSGRNTIPRQLLSRNLADEPRWQSHQACLKSSGSDASVKLFLDEIRGDIIQILLKARWQAWLNFIRAADMEIHCKTLPALDTIKLASKKPSYDQRNRAQESIRLLAIHPGSGTETLSCVILSGQVLDNDLKEFESLSYSWGNSQLKNTVQLHQPNHIAKSIQLHLHYLVLFCIYADQTQLESFGWMLYALIKMT